MRLTTYVQWPGRMRSRWLVHGGRIALDHGVLDTVVDVWHAAGGALLVDLDRTAGVCSTLP